MNGNETSLTGNSGSGALEVQVLSRAPDLGRKNDMKLVAHPPADSHGSLEAIHQNRTAGHAAAPLFNRSIQYRLSA
jgi:hypothetical protein